MKFSLTKKFSPVGKSGTPYWNPLNQPTGLASQFIVNTVLGQLDWTDNSGGKAQYEIWSATNGDASVYIGITSAGAITYNDTACKQNASVVYSIRGKRGGQYSDFISATALVTPLCFKTNQDILGNVVINDLNIVAGKTVNINWGDGTNADYTGNNVNITKGYGVGNEGQYNISLSGDVNSITKFAHKSQTRTYGSVANWELPSSMVYLSLYQMTGLTGDASGWQIPSVMTELYLATTRFTGNPFLNGVPSGLAVINCNDSKLTGEMSGVILPNISSLAMDISYADLHSLPRGIFRSLGYLRFTDNNIGKEEIDSFLAYVDNYFTGGVVPTANAEYTLDGLGVSMPTGGVLNSNIVSIKSKYVAAGKVSTFNINTFTVAYSSRTNKIQIPLTTYIGGDNETVHPSVVNYGSAWNGYQYWMANTPMPQDYENPSIWASHDGITWVIPSGVVNPVVAKPVGISSLNYNADPNLFFEGSVLYMIFMQRIAGVPKTMMTYSSDGSTWVTPFVVIDSADAEGDTDSNTSPSLCKIGATYYIYYLDLAVGAYHLRRRSCATIDGTYSDAEDVTLTNVSGQTWWHLGVLNIGGVIWLAVQSATVANTNSYGTKIYMAKSADGITFTRDSDTLPTVVGTEYWEDRNKLYRPCLVYIGTQLTMYHSYKTPADKWATAKTDVFIV